MIIFYRLLKSKSKSTAYRYRRLAHAFDETMQRIITDTLYRSNIAELHGINDHVYIHNNTTRGRIRLCSLSLYKYNTNTRARNLLLLSTEQDERLDGAIATYHARLR